jgi:hypothetical protein
MDCRFPVIGLFLMLVFFTAFSGCTSAAAQPGTAAPVHETPVVAEKTIPAERAIASRQPAIPSQNIADQLAAVRSDNPVWREAYRMFLNMNSTEYVPPPYQVDDARGIYRFDCLGFVDHVMMNADPAGYHEIGEGGNPDIQSYAAYFNRLDTTMPDVLGWTKVDRSMDLKPGDVCLWLKPRTRNNGHMWIIAGEPQVNPKRNSEVLVRIFDSSWAHSDDSRTGSACPLGLGSGILGMMVDGPGNPIGFYWDGGTGPASEKDTIIVCGRLNRQVREGFSLSREIG